MHPITIGRYKPAPECGVPVPEGSTDVADIYAGWIEGTRDDGTTWIMWLDAHGCPEQYWGQRDADGGVEGTPIFLS